MHVATTAVQNNAAGTPGTKTRPRELNDGSRNRATTSNCQAMKAAQAQATTTRAKSTGTQFRVTLRISLSASVFRGNGELDGSSTNQQESVLECLELFAMSGKRGGLVSTSFNVAVTLLAGNSSSPPTRCRWKHDWKLSQRPDTFVGRAKRYVTKGASLPRPKHTAV